MRILSISPLAPGTCHRHPQVEHHSSRRIATTSASMIPKLHPSEERLIAPGALISTFLGMSLSNVLLHVTLLHIASTTVRTRKRPLTSVQAQMSVPVALLRESFLTERTNIRPVLGVRLPMCLNVLLQQHLTTALETALNLRGWIATALQDDLIVFHMSAQVVDHRLSGGVRLKGAAKDGTSKVAKLVVLVVVHLKVLIRFTLVVTLGTSPIVVGVTFFAVFVDLLTREQERRY